MEELTGKFSTKPGTTHTDGHTDANGNANIGSIMLYPDKDEIHLRRYKFHTDYRWVIVQKRWYWSTDNGRTRIYRFKASELNLPHNWFYTWEEAEQAMLYFFKHRYLGYYDGETDVWKHGKKPKGKKIVYIPET